MKTKLVNLFLSLIIVFGWLIRIVGLEISPVSINWDEASLGYNAYSLAVTGKDEYGKFWPVSLRSFSDYKPALYTFLTVPWVKFFGLSQTTTRLVSAIFGGLSIIAIWLFLKHWVKNDWLRLIVTFFLSMEPWRIHFSRTALETNLSMAFFVFCAYFLFLSSKKIKKYLLISLFFGVASAYSYHSARLAVPLLYIFYFVDPVKWMIKEKIIIKKGKYLLSMIGLFGLLLLPIFFEAKSGDVLTRFRQENIFTRYWPYAPSEIFKYDIDSYLRLNPAYYLAELILGHIISYWSPENFSTNVFLWIRKSVQFIPEFNLFGWWEVGLFVTGIFILVTKIRQKKNRFVVYWILAASAPAAVTWNWFHSLRFLNGLPAIELVMVLGFLYWWKKIKKLKLVVVSILILFCWQTVFIINNELVYAVWENHGEYQPGGFKEGVPLLKELEKDYDQVIIDSPHAQSYIFFLFYQSFHPQEIQEKASSRTKVGEEGSWNFDFGKYKFRKINWNEDKKLVNTILWMDAKIEEREIESLGNAKAYYLPSPNSQYNSAMIICLD